MKANTSLPKMSTAPATSGRDSGDGKKIKVVVGSTNPVKVKAMHNAFATVFGVGEDAFEVTGGAYHESTLIP
jgi:hypothetical protein